MKKLLSICFLSILLGLLSFSTQAQSNCYGFWMENLNPDVLEQVANCGDMTGTYALNHTLGHAVLIGQSNRYVGNVGAAALGQTELYELHFCDTASGKKLSFDWQLERRNPATGNWEIVNENLSAYADLAIYTLYPEINQAGQCQSIKWLGGLVPDGFGFCEQQNPTLLDQIHGVTGCNTPTNYPGALQSQAGTLPGSVVNVMGQTTPSMGMTPIYSQGYDYFYADFLASTRTIVTINWKQVGDYRLVMRVRERVGGTDWTNTTWNKYGEDNVLNETAYIGGHMSCCGPVLISDTLQYPVFDTLNMEVCMGTEVEMGSPYTYNFGETHRNIIDTTLLIGQFVNQGCACEYIDIDIIRNVNFYLRHVPVVTADDTTICRCDAFTVDSLMALVHPDTVGLNETASTYEIQWWNGVKWDSMPNFPSQITPGTRTYYIRQVNTYNDTLECVGPTAHFTVTVLEVQAPELTVPAKLDYCLEEIDGNLMLHAVSDPDDNCANTTRWYTKLNCADGKYYYQWIETLPNYRTLSNIVASSLLANQGNDLLVNLQDYMPSINKDTTIYFFATSYSNVTGCESPVFAFFKVNLHQTPKLVATPMDSMYCPGGNVTMEVTVANIPFNVNPQYHYYWIGESNVVNVYNETSTSTDYTLPLYSKNKYSYSQQIVTKDEISAGSITSMGLSVAENAATRNLSIYLSTTDLSIFGSQWDTVDNKVLVYNGDVEFEEGWNDIKFSTPFNYDGTKNLLVTIVDNTGEKFNKAIYFNSTTLNSIRARRTYSDNAAYSVNYAGTGLSVTVRDNMRFMVAPSQVTDQVTSTYTQGLVAKCDSAYTTSVIVVDGNNCTSAPVEFHYFTGDTVAPEITPATVSYGINACEITSQNVPAYTTLESLVAAFNLDIDDNCGEQYVTLVGHNDNLTIDSCQQTLVRTYTFKDLCNNTATFTQTVVSRDSVAPNFTFERPIRLNPIPAGDCKFDAPARQVMIDAIAPYVADNCTDSAFLMDGITFLWENTDKDPAADTNIFILKNHLTITATITDKCGNSFTDVVFFLDRPDQLEVVGHPVTSTGDVCEEQTAELYFDMTSIVDDNVVGPFPPYTLTWYEVNGKNVTFSDIHNDTTTVTFNDGPGDYTFAMRVVNGNDCEAVSAPAIVNVRELPSLSIIPIVQLPGVVEPYCPTYGNLTIEAVVENAQTSGATSYNYTWSGESVNIYSTTETTWITIIPEWCDTTYTATVVVADERGCTAEISRTFAAAAHEMIFNGIVPDSTVNILQGCELRVPDYSALISAANITDDCYTFSQITSQTGWYKQTPAAGTTFDADQVEVTITITNPCGQKVTTTTHAVKPANYPSVTIVPADTALCYNDIFNGVQYNTIGTNLDAATTWAWTIANDTIGTEDNLLIPNNVFTAPVNKDTTYVVKVNAVNGLGCPASATANLTVYYQGDSVQLRVWKNNLCGEDHYNGVIAVDFVPTNYVVTLSQGQVDLEVKISDNNQHEHTDWNTVIFDSLAPGYYTVTVENLHGCTMSADTFVGNENVIIPEPTVTITDVTVCTDDNGVISVVRENNYAFTLFNATKTVEYTGVVAGANINFSGLSAGVYNLVKTHIPTGCEFTFTDTVLDKHLPETRFDVQTTDNTHCVTPNGTLTFHVTAPNPLTLHVWTDGHSYDYTTGPITNDTVITGLGSTTGNVKYYYQVTNTVTECEGEVLSTVVQRVVTIPSFTVTPSNNTICANNSEYNNNVENLVNGKLTIAPANTYTYTVIKKNGAVYNDTVTTSLSALSAGYYRVVALNESNGCTAVKDTNISNTLVYPAVQSISKEPNTVCDTTYAHNYDGSLKIKVKANPNTPSTNFNNYIRPYMIVLNGDTVITAATQQESTINHLKEGTYNYYIQADNRCYVAGSTNVEKYVFDTMKLATTPDHFCAPTFEKPGDGTIVVLAPRNSAEHGYKYKFFDADSTEMTVPYEMPMTYTKYWLADGEYTVFAIDTITGCTFTDNATVGKALYTITITAATTPSTYCSQTSGDGSITVTATSTNPDAVFNYSLDNQNWQVSNVFNNLANTSYEVYVKDITTRCVDSIPVGISYSDCRPTITIVDQEGNTAPFEFCINDEGTQLCANAFYGLGSECEGTFTYHWHAPCSDPNSSDESCIVVNPEHVIANGCDYVLTVTNQLTGCSYDTTVHVFVNPRPLIGFNVTTPDGFNHTYYEQEQSIPFCEQENLHITVVSMNGQTLVPELTYWTLGHIGTGLSFDTTGAGYTQDYITICAYSTSDKGCVSKIASLPLNFNRVERTIVDTTVCTSFLVPGTYNQRVTSPNGVYPYYDTVSHTYHFSHPYCDSIVTYNVKLIAAPVITPLSETVAAFCEDENYTLADFADSFAVNTNGAQTTTYWMHRNYPNSYTWYEVNETQVVDYAYSTTHRDRYCATNTCGTVFSSINFTVSKAPEITNFQVPSKYCRGEQVTLPYSYKTYRPAIAVLTIGGDTVQTWTTSSNYTSTYNRYFTFTPNHANYNGKTIALTVRNTSDLCDVATASALLTVDTNIKKLATHAEEYCEGEKIDYDTYLPDQAGYYNVRMYIVGQNNTYVPDETQVTYPDMNGAQVFFTLVDNVCSLNIATDTATITVKPLPHVALSNGAYYNVCEGDFTMPNITKTPQGIQSLITAEGWLVFNQSSASYVPTTAAAIKAAAADNNVYFCYYVKTDCGSDTTALLLAHVNDAPEIDALPTLTICPDNTISQVLPASSLDITWHNMLLTNNNFRSTRYYLVKNTSRVEVYPTSVFGNYYAYNNGKLRVVVTNECGADSAEVTIHIPVYGHEEIAAVDTCKGLTIAAFAATPQWASTADNVVASETWMRLNNNNEYVATTASYQVNNTTTVMYRWITTCNDTLFTEPVTLHPLLTPTVTITVPGHAIVNDAVSICEGNTLSPVANYDYAQYHSTVTNTEWFFNGNAFVPTYQFTANDDNKKLVVKVTTTCEEAYDTIVVRVHPTPDPSIDGPLTACSGEEITVTAEAGFDSYIFTMNGQASQPQSSNVFETTVFDNNPDGVDITTITVTVTDEFGCTGTSSDKVEVSVTDQAAFVFFNANGSENETHQYSVNDGNGLNYGWMISTECSNYDTLVYVEYDIYYEGQLISNDAIGDYFHTGNYINEYGFVKPYISSNEFGWFSGDGTALSNISYYNHAVANPNVATNGNHFPNTNLGLSNTNVYDDLWLRFIGDRKVNATLVPFRLDGEYKIVYRLYATNHADDFEHFYTEDNPTHANVGQTSHLGGQNALINGATRSLLAIDSIIINVENAVAGPSETPAPALAPAISSEENVIVPEMEVWPNPAPSIVTTFKARVFNMSGDATVTITNFSGKQVYHGDIYIDSDNFYFEADVNSLAVGAYIMTVRTNDAVVTKKLVVTVRQ